MKTDKVIVVANKITFLVKQYPQLGFAEILKLLYELPDLEVNAGLWYAQNAGWLSKPIDDKINVIGEPTHWHFGQEVDALADTLYYCFKSIAEEQIDVEENTFNGWVGPYPALDVFVATRKLIEDKMLATYTIDDLDGEGATNTYVFYTLFENLENRWGEKAFKKKPVTPRLKHKRRT